MRRWVMVAALAAAGCGGGGSGSGGGPAGPASTGTALTTTGSVAFNAINAAAASGASSCQAAGLTYGLAWAALLAPDQSGICGYLQRGQDKASARSIQIAVVEANPTGPNAAITGGAYPVVASPDAETRFALVVVSQSDAACAATDVAATSGTVTITSTAGGRLMGSVDATLEGGGTVRGTFDAEACTLPNGGDICAGQIGPQDLTCAP
jgi:hypothetical protein